MIDQDILDKLTPEERERLEWQAPKPVTRSTGAPWARTSRQRAGIATTEFWVVLSAIVIPQLHDSLPPEWQAGLATVAAAVYAIARAIVKSGIGAPPDK